MKYLRLKIFVKLLRRMVAEVIERTVAAHTVEEDPLSGILKGLEGYLGANLLPEGHLTQADFEGKSADEVRTTLFRMRSLRV